jgi:hypothetical protein
MPKGERMLGEFAAGGEPFAVRLPENHREVTYGQADTSNPSCRPDSYRDSAPHRWAGHKYCSIPIYGMPNPDSYRDGMTVGITANRQLLAANYLIGLNRLASKPVASAKSISATTIPGCPYSACTTHAPLGATIQLADSGYFMA